jgi:ABC-type uncharacterized transport system permease subunit
MDTPLRFFSMLALAGYFAASLLAVAAQLGPGPTRQRPALALALTAFVLHTLVLLLLCVGEIRFDLRLIFLLISWGLFALTAVLGGVRRNRLGALQAAAYPICTLIFLVAVMQPEGEIFKAAAAKGLGYWWFLAHLMALLPGVVLCAAAALYSILYLLEDRRLRTVGAAAGGSLPSLETSDRLAIRCLGSGFAALSFGIFAGLTLLKFSEEKRPPIDLVSGVTLALWALVLVIILARALGGLSGRRSAWLQLAAALLAALSVGLLSLH